MRENIGCLSAIVLFFVVMTIGIYLERCSTALSFVRSIETCQQTEGCEIDRFDAEKYDRLKRFTQRECKEGK